MATEKNPYDMIPQETAEIVPLEVEDTNDIPATFEVTDDGGVIVDFSENVEMEASEEISEWYGNLADTMEEGELDDIAQNVIDNYEADKDSRSEWESMFERGFDLLGLKLEQGSEPFEGACTAVHPLLIESAVCIADFLNINPLIIALSMVAIGTSLPELVVSSMAAYKGESDIAVGNVLGSNVFNIFLILGFSALFVPLNARGSIDHILILVAVTLVMFPVLYTKSEISRLKGVFLLVLYSIFIWYIFFL